MSASGMRSDLRVLALLEAVERVEAEADDVVGFGMLERRLAASIAGVDNATEYEWLMVVQLLRAKVDPA